MRRGRVWLHAVVLACSTALYPSDAMALPLLGFLGGLLASAGVITPLIGFGSIAAVNAGFAVGAFLATGFGQLLLAVGSTALQMLFAPKPQGQSIESARVNSRILDGPRWIVAGKMAMGGQAAFGAFDAAGNFWYIIIHCDSELVTKDHYILDEIVVEVNSSNRVTTAEFTIEQEEGGTPWLSIWTQTYTPSNPVPPALAAFKAAFTEWTDDHKLAGTTYTIIKCDALDQEDRYKAMTWRGPFGLGEPSVVVVGDWSRVYDPREESHDIDDPSTWESSRNAELIWAWFRTHPYGRAKPMSSIDWDQVAAQATICDQTVLDKNGDSHARYICGVAVPDDKPRVEAENEIKLSSDGVILFNDEGKAWLSVGHYAAPTLTLSRAADDILALAKRDARDGEMETDGVVVYYLEPEFNLKKQPCAPWINTAHYDPESGRAPRLLIVDILPCQDHNQAVRLAKGIGQRSQAKRRLAPTCGLRGLKAEQERIVNFVYDGVYDGTYEISTPVEEDSSGIAVSFGMVPVDANRWTLLEGEEGDRPAPDVTIDYDGDLPYPTNVDLFAAIVSGSGGSLARIEGTFDPSPRIDHRYEFQYKKTTESTYRPMLTRTADQLTYSDTVEDGATYHIQYRTVTTSGRANDWKEPPVSLTITADETAPGPVTSVVATGGTGEVDFTWSAPNSANLAATRIYRNTIDDEGAASLAATIFSAPSAALAYTDGGLAAGTYYYWLIAINGSAVPSTSVATGAVVVS